MGLGVECVTGRGAAASGPDRQAAPGSGRPAAPAARPYENRVRSRALVLVVAIVVLAVVFVLALGLGRSSISPDVVPGILAHDLLHRVHDGQRAGHVLDGAGHLVEPGRHHHG